MKEATIFISAKKARRFNNLLDSPPNDIDDGIIWIGTAKFDDGFEADIKLVGVNEGQIEGGRDISAYVDPVLFDAENCEVAYGEPDAETIDGEYFFYYIDGEDNEEEYVVYVKIK